MFPMCPIHTGMQLSAAACCDKMQTCCILSQHTGPNCTSSSCSTLQWIKCQKKCQIKLVKKAKEKNRGTVRLIVLRLLCDLTALQCKLALTDLCSCRHYEAIHPHSSQMKHLKEKYSQSFFGYTSIDHRSAVLHSYEPVQVLERPRSHGWDPPRSLDRHMAQPLSHCSVLNLQAGGRQMQHRNDAAST